MHGSVTRPTDLRSSDVFRTVFFRVVCLFSPWGQWPTRGRMIASIYAVSAFRDLGFVCSFATPRGDSTRHRGRARGPAGASRSRGSHVPVRRPTASCRATAIPRARWPADHAASRDPMPMRPALRDHKISVAVTTPGHELATWRTQVFFPPGTRNRQPPRVAAACSAFGAPRGPS
jgi:hypothetical protein